MEPTPKINIVDPITDLEVALAAGRALGGPFQTPSDGQSFIVIPNGYKAEDIEKIVAPYRLAPRRTAIAIQFDQPESFVNYVAEHKNSDSRVFVTGLETPKVTAVIDMHTKHISESREISATEMSMRSSKSGASWREHTAALILTQTEEWKRFVGADKKRMSQTSMAEFLETNQDLITAPKGAELLELVQNLEGKNNVRYDSSIKLSNGKSKLTFVEDVELKGAITGQQGVIDFPTQMESIIAPFEGVLPYKVRARMRYRIENRSLVFWFEIVDLHLILKDAVKGVVDLIAEKLAITPLYGTPPGTQR